MWNRHRFVSCERVRSGSRFARDGIIDGFCLVYITYIHTHAYRIRSTFPNFANATNPFGTATFCRTPYCLFFEIYKWNMKKEKKCENTKICECYEKVEIKIVTSYQKFLNVLFETISIVFQRCRKHFYNNKSSRLKYRCMYGTIISVGYFRDDDSRFRIE